MVTMGEANMALPPSEVGRRGFKPIVLNPTRRGFDNTTFYDKSFSHMFGKHVKFMGTRVLRSRDIRLLILNFLRTVIL